MLTRTCNNFVRSVIEFRALNKVACQYQNGHYTVQSLMPGSIRTLSLSSKLLHNCPGEKEAKLQNCPEEKPVDPCKTRDVYKVSPLCPPRGYEYKKKAVSLKCPPKKPCPSAKKTEDAKKAAESAPPPKKKEEDCDKPMPKPRKEAKKIPKKKKDDKKGGKKAGAKGDADCDKKDEAKGDVKPEAKGGAKAEAKGDAKAEAKGGAKPEAKGDVKPEAKGDVKPEAKGCTKAEGKGGAKAEAKGDKPDCKEDSPKKEEPKIEPPKKDCPTKQEKLCAKRELKGCKKPEGPPTCGKPPDDCTKLDLPKSVKPVEKPKRAKVKPDMKLDCPPSKKEDIQKKCQKKQCCLPQPEVETCCSIRPWPFSMIDKLCNKKPKQKCPVKSKEDKKECKKKMISISENNSLFASSRLCYSTMGQEQDSKRFHTSEKHQGKLVCPLVPSLPIPICPPVIPPKCSGGIELSKETEKLMVKLRAVSRANRKKMPEPITEEKLDPLPCFVPKDGWAKSHDFILMRDMEILKTLPRRVYETPRLITRKLRKRK